MNIADVVIVKNFQLLMVSRKKLGREKFSVTIGLSQKFGLQKISVANGCGRVKSTTLVARVSLICCNAMPPAM